MTFLYQKSERSVKPNSNKDSVTVHVCLRVCRFFMLKKGPDSCAVIFDGQTGLLCTGEPGIFRLVPEGPTEIGVCKIGLFIP